MILVFNAGSSTLKFKLFSSDVDSIGQPSAQVVCASVIERIGEYTGPKDHEQAIEIAINYLRENASIEFKELTAIGHRVVHAGDVLRPIEKVTLENFVQVVSGLRETVQLAPLHNPPAISCLETAFSLAPDVTNVLVFDTGFFQALPDAASSYAVPAWFADQYKIRRYGAHGTSHRFVSQQAREFLAQLGLPCEKLITLHLGNGASAAAIQAGIPVDTSMGLTPLEGLIMGTRCGDLDPLIPLYLQDYANLSHTEVSRILNKESGLKGLCGDSDMRAIEKRIDQGDASAEFAFELFCRRIQKYVGAYTAVMEGLDAIVFTAGVGENSSRVRGRVCSKLGYLGLQLDEKSNIENAKLISTQTSQVAVLTIHTDEELAIYKETLKVLS